jgi:hypothetical protein
MFPVPAVPNGMDSSLADAISSGKIRSGDAGSISNFQNVSLCKKGSAMSSALQSMLATFGNFICGIVCIRSKEKMPRVDAEPVVTVVADMEASRDIPFVDLERYAVGSLRFFADHDLPVSLRLAGCPSPAIIFTANRGFRQQSILDCSFHPSGHEGI